VAAALESAATSLGVEVRTNAHVTKILATPDRVQGVILSSGDEVSAPWVVSGADPKTTLLSLMDADVVGPTLRWRAGNIRTNGTLAKVNLVLEDLPPFRGVDDVERLRGRVLLGPDPDYLERAFDASKYGNIPDRPLIELTIPTLSDPSLAPQGTHVVSALVQWVPHPSARRGPAPRPPVDREAVADVVLATLDEHAPGLSSRVLARHVMTPLDLEQEYGLAGGHPLHADPGLDQIFAWRPLLGHASYRLAVPGLYLCGSGAHPGGGITGIPGANAARRLMEDVRGGKARSAS
jgi:phytoene dehydrogenase-like protein